MELTRKCPKCNKDMDIYNRFCPSCGEPLYFQLNKDKPKPELFIDILNSVYNLIADKNNKEREKYYPEVSQTLIFNRFKRDYESYEKKIFLQSTFAAIGVCKWKEIQNELQNLFTMTQTNALAGYSYRFTEELISNKKSGALDTKTIDRLIELLIVEMKKELEEEGHLSGDLNDPIKRRELFCFALQKDNLHMQYFLLDETTHNSWWPSVVNKNIEMGMEIRKKVFSSIYGSPEYGEQYISKNRDTIAEEVTNEIVFGYCVRLSESLFLI